MTTVIEETRRKLSDSHREVMMMQDPEQRQQAWQDVTNDLQGYDVNNPEQLIEAKAGIDTLEQVLFAAARSIGSPAL